MVIFYFLKLEKNFNFPYSFQDCNIVINLEDHPSHSILHNIWTASKSSLVDNQDQEQDTHFLGNIKTRDVGQKAYHHCFLFSIKQAEVFTFS